MKKSAILIPTGEEDTSSTPHKDISKQLFCEEKEEICVNMKKNTQTRTSMLTVSDEILTPIGIKLVPMDVGRLIFVRVSTVFQ